MGLLRRSHFFIEQNLELPLQYARDTLGMNFANDPYQLSDEDCIAIYQESYK